MHLAVLVPSGQVAASVISFFFPVLGRRGQNYLKGHGGQVKPLGQMTYVTLYFASCRVVVAGETGLFGDIKGA